MSSDIIQVSAQQSSLGGPLYGTCRLCGAWFALLEGRWEGQHESYCPTLEPEEGGEK